MLQACIYRLPRESKLLESINQILPKSLQLSGYLTGLSHIGHRNPSTAVALIGIFKALHLGVLV